MRSIAFAILQIVLFAPSAGAQDNKLPRLVENLVAVGEKGDLSREGAVAVNGKALITCNTSNHEHSPLACSIAKDLKTIATPTARLDPSGYLHSLEYAFASPISMPAPKLRSLLSTWVKEIVVDSGGCGSFMYFKETKLSAALYIEADSFNYCDPNNSSDVTISKLKLTVYRK